MKCKFALKNFMWGLYEVKIAFYHWHMGDTEQFFYWIQPAWRNEVPTEDFLTWLGIPTEVVMKCKFTLASFRRGFYGVRIAFYHWRRGDTKQFFCWLDPAWRIAERMPTEEFFAWLGIPTEEFLRSAMRKKHE